MKIQQLTERVVKLHAILADPAPGCTTWHESVTRLMDELVREWEGNTATPVQRIHLSPDLSPSQIKIALDSIREYVGEDAVLRIKAPR